MGLRRLPVSKALIELLAKEGWDSATPADPHDLEVVGARMSPDGRAVELLVASERFTGEARSFDDATAMVLNFRRGTSEKTADDLTAAVSELNTFLLDEKRRGPIPAAEVGHPVTEVAMRYIESLERALDAANRGAMHG